ncbi:MAG: histidine phosphatase family protein [Clostridia bacterium]|nr:histidine phosphatase family protein [Clostridia bacterium]
MLILLVRHGETDWNHQGRRQGRRDVPLNEQGRAQMRRCADMLASLPVDAILTSPLSRATESAAILADVLSFPQDQIRRTDGLIERDFGDVDGMTERELRAYRARGGNEKTEPLYLVRERVMRTVLNVARREKHQNVIMVSHSAAIKSIMVRLYGKPELQRATTKNAGVSIIEFKGGRLHPRLFNADAEEAARYLRMRGRME